LILIAGHSLVDDPVTLFYSRRGEVRDIDNVGDVHDGRMYKCREIRYSRFYPRSSDVSDYCISYDTAQTLWCLVMDLDLVAGVPFTAATLFNGSAGDGSLMFLSSGVGMSFGCC
jgi:hypothetical protein